MSQIPNGDDLIPDILRRAKRIALVGASDNPSRASHGVMKFLLAKGHEVIPVNPQLAGKDILGQRVAASLADVEGPIEMVDIFRNSADALGVVREAIAEKDRLAIEAIWMQLGVVNPVAAAEARAAGLLVVMDRCPKIEYYRLGQERR